MNYKQLGVIVMATASIALMGDSCDSDSDNAVMQERTAQGTATLRAVQSVGMPAINEFAEKRQLRDILELRDQSLPTITYLQSMDGRLHKLCDSIGYGIPYATEYTNPQQTSGYQHSVAIAQPDPNGLYSPAEAEGTWVLCLDPTKKKKTLPVYVEPRIVTSPFALSVNP